ncbi:uncharacterized protein LOC118827963 [Trichosurus vulpecula]|uniref:uncharacterized protein LOC118827963 n=1 Tax=Trichosurus vulpecula TaxID=9337 RepID=UPI00186B1514|nr:uncharacterized protein LOC118827963 [Trichosurus vulpecula]XP_036590211.1 uncharacterized protein LOC118827963 [Trichosurus vulpecula]XP_036590212.1 uncharacterized protein LOC118827963 [Trichosurus vulpecula]XP_036590213.1 uncharacterized protein LOC118827963 [Trichosurus vulpecula]
MGPYHRRTSWRSCILQCFTVLACCMLIKTWTPGTQVHDRLQGPVVLPISYMSWDYDYNETSMQDGFKCPPISWCNYMNWSYPGNVEVWAAPSPIFQLMKTNLTTVNVTVIPAPGANISCAITNLPFSTHLSFNQQWPSLDTTNWTNVYFEARTFTIYMPEMNNKYLYCHNATPILDRRNKKWYNKLIWTRPAAPESPGIVRVPKSCINASISQHKIVFHYNVTFPPLANCVRRKRAWYDTLLGSAGTGLGIVNSVDLEALASRLRSAGQDVSQAVNVQWLPTTILPHQNTLQYQNQFLQVFNDSTLVNLDLMENISMLFDWTECSLQNLYTLIQKENAQRLLQEGNTQIWNNILDLSKVWRKPKPENIECTPYWCTGTIVLYRVKTWTVMCQFHVIPFVLYKYFALPHIYGNYIDWYNVTHTLSDCIVTDGGMVCGMMTRQMEPCLLSHSSNLCDLTLFPVNNFSMICEVSTQHICIASNNHTDLLSVDVTAIPFSGCLSNVSFLRWRGNNFYFSPDTDIVTNFAWVPQSLPLPHVSLSLYPLINILNQSAEIKKLLESNQRGLNEHRIRTLITAGRLVEASHLVTSDTNHHWYDFLFKSSTATMYFNSLAIPILILALFFLCLCICNYYMYIKIRTIYTHVTPLPFTYYSHDLKAK